jgi:hypothetical protein
MRILETSEAVALACSVRGVTMRRASLRMVWLGAVVVVGGCGDDTSSDTGSAVDASHSVDGGGALRTDAATASGGTGGVEGGTGGVVAGSGGSGGAGDPSFAACIAEGDGFTTCEAHCASLGRHCEAMGCDGATYRGWRDAYAAQCGDNSAPDAVGGAAQCDDPLSWGPSAAHVRCCCGAGLAPQAQACEPVQDVPDDGGTLDPDAGASGSVFYSQCFERTDACDTCAEACASVGAACAQGGCSYGVETGLSAVGWSGFEPMEMCASFDTPNGTSTGTRCDRPIAVFSEWFRCCCAAN